MKSVESDNLFERMKRSMGPLAGGILLDLLDLATLGPFGLAFGWLIGGVVAWWIGSIYGFSTGKKFLLASLAAVYCMVPMTELVPLATIVSAACRFFEKPGRQEPQTPGPRKQVESKVVEPEEESGSAE